MWTAHGRQKAELLSTKYKLYLFAPQDVETGTRYLTSPVSGNTYQLAGGRPPAFPLRVGLWLDGVRNYRCDTIDAVAGLRDFTPSTAPFPVLTPQQADYLDSLWQDLERSIDSTPLRRLATCIATIRPVDCVSRAAALHLAHGLRGKGPTNCLLHSFWQAALLRRFGVPCTLLIGLWMPMEDAHAWVVAPVAGGDVVLGDNVDRVMHYAPTLAFAFGEGAYVPHTALPSG